MSSIDAPGRPRFPAGFVLLALGLTPTASWASFLAGEALDKLANGLAPFILFAVPIGGIVLFWMVHVLPEKVAEKRHHPQKDAIKTLCLLSLVFGGLLWPLAWLWAYSKPVLHKIIKLKWLPWNTTSQVIVVIIPIVGMVVLIMLLNIFAPSSSDVRVYKYTIPVVSQVKGRVIEVAVEEGNRLVKKGDVLFRVDPTPYQLAVNQLEAQIVNAEATQRELDESLKGAKAKVVESRSAIAQASARVREVAAQLELARLRVRQNGELVKTGAGSKFDLERAQTDARQLEAQLDSARNA